MAESPIPRKKTDYEDAYVKIVRDYLVIFEEDEFINSMVVSNEVFI